MKLAVVVAAYDEAQCIEPLFDRLEKVLTAMPGVTPEAIFVVEGTDGTHRILRRRTAHLPWVRVLSGEVPSGLGAAFRRGFAAVGEDADYVVTLDADLNHQPEEIPRLVAAADSRGCDVLIGSRFVAGGEVVGTPLWKRVLSGGVNRMMRFLYGLDVRDKTSGFRVYRASALRRLSFENDAFAFLPELLIAASRQGCCIGEEPIRFTYRCHGRSKMAFWPTSWSYLAMLGRRFDRWSWAVLALLALGLALRFGLTFPVHKLHSESDSVLNGLCAYRVLRGETPVFASHTRLGSIGGHLTALLLLLGAGPRPALVLGPLIESIALMGFWYLFMREALGRRSAAVALLFIAVPAPSFSFWTAMPNGYPEVMLFCGAALWLAVRAVRAEAERWPFFALGLAAGLGLWSSLQTLGCSAPAVAWLFWKRPRDLVGWAAPLVVAGFLLGAFPWLAFNLQYNFPTLRSGYATEVAPGVTAMLDNAADLLTYKLPEMVGSMDPNFWPRQTRTVRAWHPLVVGIHLVAAVLFFVLGSRARGPTSRFAHRAARENDPRLLFAWVLVAMVALNVVSVAGSYRGVTVRYILPLYLIVPGVLAFLILWVGARFRLVAGILAAWLLTFHLAGTFLPWNVERGQHVHAAARDDGFIGFLRRKGVDVVLGRYWVVYTINYFSRERVSAIPFKTHFDHYAVERRLGDRRVRWALVSPREDDGDLAAWVESAGLSGKFRPWRGYRVFFVRGRVPKAKLLGPMRRSFYAREKERLAEQEG